MAKALKNKLDAEDFLMFLQNVKNQDDMATLVVDSLFKRVVIYSSTQGGHSSHFNLPKLLKMIEVFELFQKIKVSKQQNGDAVLVFGKLKKNDEGINYIYFSAAEGTLPSLYTYLYTIQKDVINMNNQDFGTHLKKLMHVDKNHTPVVNKLTGTGKAEKKHLWSKSAISDQDRSKAVHVTLAYFSSHFKAAFCVDRNNGDASVLHVEQKNFFNLDIASTYNTVNGWKGESECESL